jgi:hypothetical protein
MQGLVIENLEDSFKLSFDKKFFEEDEFNEIIRIFELEYLSKKVNFDKKFLTFGKGIKKSMWQKEAQKRNLVK